MPGPLEGGTQRPENLFLRICGRGCAGHRQGQGEGATQAAAGHQAPTLYGTACPRRGHVTGSPFLGGVAAGGDVELDGCAPWQGGHHGDHARGTLDLWLPR